MITDAEKLDLFRAINSDTWAKFSTDGKTEILFAREVHKQGMDYEAAAEYGVNGLGLNKNALNCAFNQVQNTVGLKYI